MSTKNAKQSNKISTELKLVHFSNPSKLRTLTICTGTMGCNAAKLTTVDLRLRPCRCGPQTQAPIMSMKHQRFQQ
jgi:hypothetical protein